MDNYESKKYESQRHENTLSLNYTISDYNKWLVFCKHFNGDDFILVLNKR